MHRWVQVRAGVLEHRQPVILVRGLPQGREHHTAGGDARQHQGVDASGPQQHVQIRTRKTADPMLDGDRLPGPGGHGRVKLGAWAARREPPGLTHRPKGLVQGAHLGIVRPEAEDHVDDLYPCGPGRSQGLGGLLQQRGTCLRDHGHDCALVIHDQQSGLVLVESEVHLVPWILRLIKGAFYRVSAGHSHRAGLPSVKQKVVPSPARDSTQMLPPCCSTIFLQMARPMPVPG